MSKGRDAPRTLSILLSEFIQKEPAPRTGRRRRDCLRVLCGVFPEYPLVLIFLVPEPVGRFEDFRPPLHFLIVSHQCAECFVPFRYGFRSDIEDWRRTQTTGWNDEFQCVRLVLWWRIPDS